MGGRGRCAVTAINLIALTLKLSLPLKVKIKLKKKINESRIS